MGDLEGLRALLEAREPVDHAAERTAAVAAVLRQGASGAEVLLIQRAEREGDPWSGHMGFPGGHAEAVDRHLLDTAMRETREELGLELAPRELLGRLDDVPTHRTGMVVRPYVFGVARDVAFRPNEEVAEVLWAPIAPMVAGLIDTQHPVDYRGQRHAFPAYDVDGRIVWGLTYRMLRMLFGMWQS